MVDNFGIWSSAQTPKSNGNGNGTAYGIKKLRELILELAVRGKLVPQDPNDEPTAILLRRIAKEKKKHSPEEIKPGKEPFQLPSGWEWVTIGEVAQHNSGKTLDAARNTGSFQEYITTSNLYWGYFVLGDLRKMRIRDEEVDKCTAKRGDLLVCEGGEAGRAAVWNYPYDICFQNHIHRIRLYDGINSYYVYRCFQRINHNGEIDLYRKGVGISNMSGKSLASVPIPLPPLAEQHRIVAKVDELMVLCDQLEQRQNDNDKIHESLVETLLTALVENESDEAWQRIQEHFDTLFVTEESVDQLKQTILQLAVMGKLVPQDPNDEPTSMLLQKIAKEKARLIKEGKIRKQEPLPEIKEEENPFLLPNGWKWTRLNDAIDVRDGTHDTPKEAFGPNTYPLVTSKDFCNGLIEFGQAKRISEIDHLEISKRSLVEKYDILFSMIGGNLGNQVMVYDDTRFSVKNVALFKYYDKSLTTPYFIKKLLEYIAFDLQTKANGGAQPFVSLRFLRSIVVGLPPIAEQHRIVAKVDELMALCDNLKARLREVQTTQVQLANAVVEQMLM